MQGKRPEVVKMADIPFPDARDIRHIAKELGGGKKAFQTLAMRWHPDKFAQKFGSNISSADKAAIYDKVKEVFQAVNTERKAA